MKAVHPRARGEHKHQDSYIILIIGSSPRTRGTLSLALFVSSTSRFIPAHAGNTILAPLPPVNHTVHPRARGEHNILLMAFVMSGGSSPRTRGTLFEQLTRNNDFFERP